MRPARRPAPRPAPAFERDLVLRLGTALLREDVAGLRTRGQLMPAPSPRVAHGGSGLRSSIGWTQRVEKEERYADLWLALNGLRLPVRVGSPSRGDLVSDLVMREPRVIRVSPTSRSEATRLSAVVHVLESELLSGVAPGLAHEYRTGFRALLAEARAAGSAAKVRRAHRSEVMGRLRVSWTEALATPTPQPDDQTVDVVTAQSWEISETLSAYRDHPIYPFSMARVGLRRADLRRWAPEHAPRFGLRWVSVPRELVSTSGDLPGWWPGDDRVAIPVHPAMTKKQLGGVLEAAKIPARPFPAPRLQVRPTLSMRTVVPEADRSVHLKVPMPMRTLGRLNLRLVSRASLADGAVLSQGLSELIRNDGQFAESVLTADESTWLHADNHLAVLVRRWPVLTDARVLPVAGLTARGWDGRLLGVMLAERFFGGDLDAFLGSYLRTLLTWQVTLWLKHGIVHEAHSQNVLVVVDENRVRLLLRDLDSCLVDPDLGSSVTQGLAERLTDHRLIAKDPVDLAAMFVTTTLHQCVASVLISTATALGRPVTPLLAQVRPLLLEIAESHPDARDTALLTSGIARAERLPVKRTLTAATLLPKSRTGAADVNKFYGADAPTYL
ncbi:IucA/IucC family siderophore biosynthesis protein [Kineosporia succinea]|uniref:Siderophore synthetase component n=1 Tax=Kineosporia succinea TaxID=84632 RepID=A0ABT9P1K0_9ACTN|nr:IucA/IucC family siderophore biosynthesis protein [Kineosporia succinea]MDP9826441.1 siderophore synthetase component [Kineosporia succinea]